MRIIEVEPIVLRIRKLDTERRTEPRTFFLVRVHTEQETVGIGEADTSPYVARTIIEMPSSHSIARGLAELLVGQNPLEIDRLRLVDGKFAVPTGPGLRVDLNEEIVERMRVS